MQTDLVRDELHQSFLLIYMYIKNINIIEVCFTGISYSAFFPACNLSTNFYMDCVTFWSLAFASRRLNNGLDLVGFCLFVFYWEGCRKC